MISATSLIAVLMQVITIIFANPNIPQDTKDQVFQQITTAINAQNGQVAQGTQTSPTTTSTPTTPQPVLGQSTPEVSQACKDETANLKEKEYNLNSVVKNMNQKIKDVDIFESGSPEGKEKRKNDIRNDFSYEITKSQDIVSKYQDKVKAVCN